jgi:glycosyltransferase involved in cell wall biosynthesis
MANGVEFRQLDLTVTLPAYNKAKRLAATVEKLARSAGRAGLRFEIIIADDASSDATPIVCAELVERYGPDTIVLIRNRINKGIGWSLRKALEMARGRSFSWLPADDDIPEESMTLMFEQRGRADMVTLFLLNREERGWKRNIVSNLYIISHVMMFKVYFLYLTGPGVYPTALLRTLDLKANRFGILAEMHVKLWRSGATLIELPTYTRTGIIDSSALKLRNLWEAFRTFSRLTWEIYVSRKDFYCHCARRIKVEFAASAPAKLPRVDERQTDVIRQDAAS